MNELHSKLTYVKSLLTAMNNLNKEEQQLLNSRQVIITENPGKVELPKSNKKGHRWILIAIFLGIYLVNVLPYAGNLYHQERSQIKIAKLDDKFIWKMEHPKEKYPGYSGKEASFLAAFVRATPLSAGKAFVITAIIGAIIAIYQKKRIADVQRVNQQREMNNQNIQKNNALILKNNAEIDKKIEHIHNRKSLISQEYMESIVEWYPKNYAYPSAVNFFINLVENHLATTIQECVNQYETQMFRQRVTDNQQEMKKNQEIMISKQDNLLRQQMIGNMINAANLVVNGQTAANTSKIANNTSQIASNTSTIANNTSSIANHVGDIANTARSINKKL